MTETKLTKPVQVGMWYETKAGSIVRMDKQDKDQRFECNNGKLYTADGEVWYCIQHEHDLIRCLGAEPFKQVDISKMETVAPTQFERIFTSVLPDNRAVLSEAAQILTIRESIRFAQEAIKQLKEIGE